MSMHDGALRRQWASRWIAGLASRTCVLFSEIMDDGDMIFPDEMCHL
jgi:hypothetical protein